jgi:hypothetical protein
VIEACRRSGLSQAEFCRRRGIPPGTLGFWKHTLTHEARAAKAPAGGRGTPPTFVPVHVVAHPAAVTVVAPGPASPASGTIEVVLGGDRCVRVHDRVDVDWLAQVLRTVERLGC